MDDFTGVGGKLAARLDELLAGAIFEQAEQENAVRTAIEQFKDELSRLSDRLVSLETGRVQVQAHLEELGSGQRQSTVTLHELGSGQIQTQVHLKELTSKQLQTRTDLEHLESRLDQDLEHLTEVITQQIDQLDIRIAKGLVVLKGLIERIPVLVVETIEGKVAAATAPMLSAFSALVAKLDDHWRSNEAMRHSLVSYMAARDRAMEEVRTRFLAELIEEAGRSLSVRQRRKMAEGLKQAEQTRRDRNDARRYRKEHLQEGSAWGEDQAWERSRWEQEWTEAVRTLEQPPFPAGSHPEPLVVEHPQEKPPAKPRTTRKRSPPNS